MANAANLVNFGSGAGSTVGDVVYSANTLTAPSYLPMVDETASYLASSYPALAALYTTPVTAYSAATTTTFSSNVVEMAFGNGIFVAVVIDTTANYSLVTSRDGVTWTQRTFYPNWGSGTTQGLYLQIYGIYFANGIFVITATKANDTNSGTQVFTSIDGINWTRTQLSGGVFGNLYPVYGGGVWLILGGNTSSWYRSIDNGATWSNYYPATTNSTRNGRAYGNNCFVSGGSLAGVDSIVYSSDGGNTWAQATTPSGSYGSIAFGNGTFVAVNTSGVSTTAITSTNGSSFTLRTLPSSSAWRSVVFGNGVFVAVSSTGTNAATSPDGITWTARVLPVSGAVMQAFCFGGPTNNRIFVGYPLSGTVGYTINLSVAQTTFTLPSMTTTTFKNMLPYIKAS